MEGGREGVREGVGYGVWREGVARVAVVLDGVVDGGG